MTITQDDIDLACIAVLFSGMLKGSYTRSSELGAEAWFPRNTDPETYE